MGCDNFIEEAGVQRGHQIMCVRFYKAAGVCATEYQTERHWNGLIGNLLSQQLIMNHDKLFEIKLSVDLPRSAV